MEGALGGAPAGRVLSLVNGAFSARFAAAARACERDMDVLEVPWGEAVDPDVVRSKLASTQYAAVTVVHSETSTGALTDIRAVTAAAPEARGGGFGGFGTR